MALGIVTIPMVSASGCYIQHGITPVTRVTGVETAAAGLVIAAARDVGGVLPVVGTVTSVAEP
jgi:hypothetical protein